MLQDAGDVIMGRREDDVLIHVSTDVCTIFFQGVLLALESIKHLLECPGE